jgi:ADP-L-glycero-D-manno-heptose 6-epimerase
MTRPIVMVTGGAGFIGSNIVAQLCEQTGFQIVVCDRLRGAETGKWRNIAKAPIHDFIDPDQMWGWLDQNRTAVQAIIHMGAISATTEPDADKIVQNNFCLSRDLWRWCAQYQSRFLYASSAATYGDGGLGFDDDNDLAALSALRPLNAYGWSKALFDIFAVRQAAAGTAPSQWAGLKFFNVYGPNEGHKGSMKSVVAQIYPRIAAGEGVSLFRSHKAGYTDGGQLRDFVYVRDVADVVAWLLDSPQVSGIFNLGTGKARTFLDLANATFAAAGQAPAISFVDTPEVIRDKYQYFTEARMSRLAEAGYIKPFTGLEDGVADYVSRFLSQPDPHR